MRTACGRVPTISVFYGIVVKMFFDDHDPPHIHVEYAGDAAAVNLATGEVMAGRSSLRALRLVREWMALRESELNENWALAKSRRPVQPVEPLP